MSGYHLLQQLGVFIREEFLSGAELASLIEEVHRSEKEPGRVEREGKSMVDTEFRVAASARVSRETRSRVESRILELQPELEAHFKVSLKGFQEASFVVYEQDAFYDVHRDSARPDETEASQKTRERILTIVLFLNGQSETPEPGSFVGGELHLLGLMQFPGSEGIGLPVRAAPGLLVAFRSETWHKVTRIDHGRRQVIVGCWR